MKDFFDILAFLSLLAFVVGMCVPKTVIPTKLPQNRGVVALVYIGLFIVFFTISGNFAESSGTQSLSVTTTTLPPQTEQTEIEQPQKSDESESRSCIGETISVGHFAYTVNSIRYKKTVGDSYFNETADGIFLLINISIKNISDETRTIDSSCFTLVDDKGREYEYAIDASNVLEVNGSKSLFLKQCQPGISTKGTLIFEVPEKQDYYLVLSGSFWGGNTKRVLLK